MTLQGIGVVVLAKKLISNSRMNSNAFNSNKQQDDHDLQFAEVREQIRSLQVLLLLLTTTTTITSTTYSII